MIEPDKRKTFESEVKELRDRLQKRDYKELDRAECLIA